MNCPKRHQSHSDSRAEGVSQAEGLDRRTFLVRGGAAVATAAALAGLPYALRKDLTRETLFVLFSAQQRQAVSAVQEHLFPHAPHSPGAADVNATAYLEWAITAPGLDPDTRNTIVNGVGRLQDASLGRFDVLLGVESFGEGGRRDKLRNLDSGLNHIMAKIAAKKKIAIGIDVSGLRKLGKKDKGIRLARVRRNIEFCRRAGAKMVVFGVDDPLEGKSFMISLGASSRQAKNAVSF